VDLGDNKIIEFRAAVLNLYLMIASVTSAVIVPIYYVIGITPLTLACAAYGAMMIACCVLFRARYLSLRDASRAFLGMTFLVCMAGLYLGNETIDNKPWQLLVPLAAFTVAGAREGTWWSIAAFVGILVICALRWPVYAPLPMAVLLVAYATTGVALYFYTDHSESSLRTVDRLSHTDSLTGVYNRQFFDELTQQSFNRSRRAVEPLAVFMIEIDHFKPFNDTYGHVAGDAALAAVGSVIRTSARRASDLVFRYGGEEFCIFSAGLDAAAAAALAETILKGVHGLDIEHIAGTHGILSVSIGYVHRTHLDSESVDSLLRSADAALYRAKRRGRGRVENIDGSWPPMLDVANPAA
jgi:diguanylate cyclase (GGDEF)-like protein